MYHQHHVYNCQNSGYIHLSSLLYCNYWYFGSLYGILSKEWIRVCRNIHVFLNEDRSSLDFLKMQRVIKRSQ
jgi:hypothetical protein